MFKLMDKKLSQFYANYFSLTGPVVLLYLLDLNNSWSGVEQVEVGLIPNPKDTCIAFNPYYNHATTNLAICSNETSQDKLSKA